MNCPYCGGEMQSGQMLIDGRGWVSEPLWKADDKKYDVLDRVLHTDGRIIQGLPISGLSRMRISGYHCSACEKFIFEGRVNKY